MAIELAPHNIQVNAIAPGWIETDMTAPVKSMPLNAEILTRTPAGRWGQPEEVAGTAVFLASRASDFVTGRHYSRRWWLRDPIAVLDSKMIVRAPKPANRGRINGEQ